MQWDRGWHILGVELRGDCQDLYRLQGGHPRRGERDLLEEDPPDPAQAPRAEGHHPDEGGTPALRQEEATSHSQGT